MIDEKSLGDELSVLWDCKIAFESVGSACIAWPLHIGAFIYFICADINAFPLFHPRGLLTNAEAAPSHVRLGIRIVSRASRLLLLETPPPHPATPLCLV